MPAHEGQAVRARAAGPDPVVPHLVVAREIALRVAPASGLLARYALREPRPGGTPGMRDGLAAAYPGISVAFGPHPVARADAWFAHRFAGFAGRPSRSTSFPPTAPGGAHDHTEEER